MSAQTFPILATQDHQSQISPFCSGLGPMGQHMLLVQVFLLEWRILASKLLKNRGSQNHNLF